MTGDPDRPITILYPVLESTYFVGRLVPWTYGVLSTFHDTNTHKRYPSLWIVEKKSSTK